MNGDRCADRARSRDIAPELDEVRMRHDPVGNVDREAAALIAGAVLCHEDEISGAVEVRASLGTGIHDHETTNNCHPAHELHHKASKLMALGPIRQSARRLLEACDGGIVEVCCNDGGFRSASSRAEDQLSDICAALEWSVGPRGDREIARRLANVASILGQSPERAATASDPGTEEILDWPRAGERARVAAIGYKSAQPSPSLISWRRACSGRKWSWKVTP